MYIVILNPAAGNGRAKRLHEQICTIPLYKEKDCRTFTTEYAGHGESLTRQLVEIYKHKIECVIVIGGDGTVHEVLNGLKKFPDIPLAFIPGGSGNDFGKATLHKNRPDSIFQSILNAPHYSPYRAGMYRMNRRNQKDARLFANSIGFGFDGEIVQAANKSAMKKWLNHYHAGFLIYCLALLRTLRTYKPKTIEVTVDGDTHIYQNIWMVTIGVHGYYGGGMKILPGASEDSERLSLLILQNIPKWKVLLMFATVFWGGHTRLKEVEILTGYHVEVKSNEALAYHVDGEGGYCKSSHIYKEKIPRAVFKGKK
ncbi:MULTISPECIES: diacylglycerol/lipid kinase family protein [Pontibacillus]|uniref:Diacylglycerol kinase family lipid kinase n=1 Tax=Pontibacillus chungwhensis TaxID=265426 RepID=A0ABY8UXZ4_9BACI|nr:MULTISPECIES: diacylglycerol kinase family protein [Pontibacillus]MCD5323914.1 diacylglycerol kinase family lipid kinase [Pontibacillus sp. HN14]WIF97270.1 diacylglycerol kinase family lipid kinase [Pontibacillus chungwhensis]